MKTTLSVFAALFLALSLPAQTIRTNYRSEGMTHISTEGERLRDFDARVEFVGFPDGSTLYLLYIDYRQPKSFTVPKGMKMTATLTNGSFIRADQIGRDNATKPRLLDGTFLNRLQYAVEADDMDKLISRGVKDLEISISWDPDGFFRYDFSDNAFSTLLKRHCEAILAASEQTVDLTAEAAGRIDQANSILTAAEPIVADGEAFKYNIILSHLYYKDTASEDIDLAFQLGSEKVYTISTDAPVTFILADGTEIALPQTRDDKNFVYLYPSMDQVRALSYGSIAHIRIETGEGVLSDTILDDTMSKAINQEYQRLMALSGK